MARPRIWDVGNPRELRASGSKRGRFLLIGLGMWLFALSGAARSAPLVRSQLAASGLERPIFATSAPGDPERLYILEQGVSAAQPAAIRLLDLRTGHLADAPFLEIPDLDFYDLGGALGLAFDPNYEFSGRFYVSGATRVGGQPFTAIREYQVSPNNHSLALPQSGRTVAQFPALGGNHNGGWIGFGPEGLLYWARGDGRSGTGQGLVAQDLESALGKILRIDVRRDDFPLDAARNYGIPAGNPFVGAPGLDEIWALGLRHAWRNSFDRATGHFYIADVGSNRFEEINFQLGGSGGGANYAWPYREGAAPNPNFPGTADDPTDPVYAYARQPGELSAVTGGYVYRGSRIPALDGTYLFADFPTAQVASLYFDGQGFGPATDWTSELVTASPWPIQSIASFGEDALGELYLIDYVGGQVLAIVPGLVGDANGDCSVGAADYALWAAQFGQTGPGHSADFDGDGSVGLGDYTLWAANFGRSCSDPLGAGPGSAASRAVPEPTGAMLAALGLTGVALAGWRSALRRSPRPILQCRR